MQQRRQQRRALAGLAGAARGKGQACALGIRQGGCYILEIAALKRPSGMVSPMRRRTAFERRAAAMRKASLALDRANHARTPEEKAAALRWAAIWGAIAKIGPYRRG